MRAVATTHAARINELWRFYKVGIVNTIFGFGLYSFLVFVGLNLFIAQITSQVCGVIFNYFTFSRHVFPDRRPSIGRFVGSYALNYLVGLLLLRLFIIFIRSPYVAGLCTTLVASALNYVVLKTLVFRRRDS
jgi:putative flippase GtrA